MVTLKGILFNVFISQFRHLRPDCPSSYPVLNIYLLVTWLKEVAFTLVSYSSNVQPAQHSPFYAVNSIRSAAFFYVNVALSQINWPSAFKPVVPIHF